jgi:hypothetical protein
MAEMDAMCGRIFTQPAALSRRPWLRARPPAAAGATAGAGAGVASGGKTKAESQSSSASSSASGSSLGPVVRALMQDELLYFADICAGPGTLAESLWLACSACC